MCKEKHMREIQLSQEQVTLVDDEDFDYLNQWSWCILADKWTLYACRRENKKTLLLMHRVLMKTPKGLVVDHKDHNGLNNQKDNLRNCTQSQNSCNMQSRKNFTTKGVSHRRKRSGELGNFSAYITIDGRKKWLGTYKTDYEAALVYNAAAILQYGEFANLNKVDGIDEEAFRKHILDYFNAKA